MIENIPQCLNTLSKKDLDKLEKILAKQYFKVCKFYKVIKKHSCKISDIIYDYTNDDIMDITLCIITSDDINLIFNDINDYIAEKGYKIETSIVKKNNQINISINEKE